MTKGFIAYFWFSRTTPAGDESCNLELAHGDYTFDWVSRLSDGKGAQTTKRARGRWTQTGDDITFIVEHADPGSTVPPRATEHGPVLDVEGFGKFELDR